jgi:hypothetical protein
MSSFGINVVDPDPDGSETFSRKVESGSEKNHSGSTTLFGILGFADGLPGFQSEQHDGEPEQPAAEQSRLFQRTHG